MTKYQETIDRILELDSKRTHGKVSGKLMVANNGLDVINDQHDEVCTAFTVQDADFIAATPTMVKIIKAQAKAIEALDWFLHCANGIGKTGQLPSEEEYEKANEAAQNAIKILEEIE